MDGITLPVEVEMPSVQIVPASNSQLDEAHAGSALRSLLLDRYIVVDAGADSDFNLAVNLRAERRTPSGDLGNFHTAYVQGARFVQCIGQHRPLSGPRPVKGVQLHPATALSLALSNAAEALREKHGNDYPGPALTTLARDGLTTNPLQRYDPYCTPHHDGPGPGLAVFTTG